MTPKHVEAIEDYICMCSMCIRWCSAWIIWTQFSFAVFSCEVHFFIIYAFICDLLRVLS